MPAINPFIRYIALIEDFSNEYFTKAYDCRFIYVIEGSCTLYTEQGNFTLNQDTLAYYPCGTIYFPQKNNTARGKYISVNFDFTDQFSYLNECILPVAVTDFNPKRLLPTYLDINYEAFSNIFVINSVPYMQEDLMRLLNLHRQNNPYAQKACSSLMSALLYGILYKLDKNEVSNEIVLNVKKYIKNQFFNDIDNQKIADSLTYHPYYLNSVFKMHTGKTIHKYLMEYRVKKSCELLVATNMSIQDIAFACGFSNQTHFSAYFKKINKISPLNYRKKYNTV